MYEFGWILIHPLLRGFTLAKIAKKRSNYASNLVWRLSGSNKNVVDKTPEEIPNFFDYNEETGSSDYFDENEYISNKLDSFDELQELWNNIDGRGELEVKHPFVIIEL
jgi:hypothetical protein